MPVPTLLLTSGDPCAGLTCNSPGACQVLPGECRAGACRYAPAPEGTECGAGGKCTAAQQCTGKLGEASGSFLASHSLGKLALWASSPTNMPYILVSTRPAAVDPCSGVACESPGDCEIGPGTCTGGRCSYFAKPAGSSCGNDGTCDAQRQCSTAVQQGGREKFPTHAACALPAQLD